MLKKYWLTLLLMPSFLIAQNSNYIDSLKKEINNANHYSVSLNPELQAIYPAITSYFNTK